MTKMMNKFTENYVDISIDIQICYLGGELQQKNLNGKKSKIRCADRTKKIKDDRVQIELSHFNLEWSSQQENFVKNPIAITSQLLKEDVVVMEERIGKKQIQEKERL